MTKSEDVHMTIGMMISPIRSVPPTDGVISAPSNLVVDLSNGLVEKGHAVYLFAAHGSHSKATLLDFGIEPTSAQKHMMTAKEYKERVSYDEARLFQKMIAFGQEKKIDVFHLHQVLDMKPLISATSKNYRFVITLHDPIEGANKDAVSDLTSCPNVWFVPISRSQERGGPSAMRFIDVVYHGIDPLLFPFSSATTGYLAVMGRILPKKGQDDAIAIARQTHHPLYIAGKYYTDTKENTSYWEKDIAPYIDAHAVVYVPVIPKNTLAAYYQGAQALLMPIKWEEPFGLVMIEAMSSGTPVIAYNRGSVPEIVKDGTTGFIIDPDDEDRPGKGTWTIKKQGIDGMVEAVRRIGEIDRKACRRHVEEHFTLEHMVKGYERVYRKIIASQSV